MLLLSTSSCIAVSAVSAEMDDGAVVSTVAEQASARLAVEAVLFPTPTPLPPTLTPSPVDPPPTSIPTSIPSPTLSPTPTYAYGPDYFPPSINPLTGLAVQNQDLLARRPLLVKVTNFPRSVRPQWGLSRADHVFEYYIADDMTRFMGVFYGQNAERVGPVRSARLFDEHVMRMYSAIFTFGWADDPILERLLVDDLHRYLLVENGDNCPPLCRIGPEGAYNTLYLDTTQTNAYLEARRTDNTAPELTGLRFEALPPPSGHPADEVTANFSLVSYHQWVFEPASGRYLRFQETDPLPSGEVSFAPLTDSLTGEQLAADNLLFLLVPHQYFHKSSSTEIFDQIILGSGTGFGLRDSQIYPLRWTQSAPDQLFRLELPDGQRYPLKPGNVWFEILSPESELIPLPFNSWQFNFILPEPVPTPTEKSPQQSD